MYFRVSVVSELGTRAPTPLEVTQPQNITEIRLFSSWIGHGISSLHYFHPGIAILALGSYQKISGKIHDHTIYKGNSTKGIYNSIE